jgi:superkiller protein 3
LGEQVVAVEPSNARAYNLLGAAYASLREPDRARRAFQASVRANPRDPSTYVNLGVFELQSANPAAAAEHFAEALTLDPGSSLALSGLSDAVERRAQLARPFWPWR